MSVIFLLITASTIVAGIFLVAFLWAIRNGQYEDDRSPAVRILLDDTTPQAPSPPSLKLQRPKRGEGLPDNHVMP